LSDYLKEGEDSMEDEMTEEGRLNGKVAIITGQALPVDGGNTASLNLPGMKL